MVLNILGAQVRVVYKKDSELDSAGEAKFSVGEIWLRRSLKGKERKQVLYHEVMHWILYRSGLAEGLNKIIEEAICDASGFVFSENKIL